MSEEFAPQTDVWTIDEKQNPEKYPNGVFTIKFSAGTSTTPGEKERCQELAFKINVLTKTCGRSADRTERNADLQNQLREERFKELKRLAEALRDEKIDYWTAFERYGQISGTYHANIPNAERRNAATISSDHQPDETEERIWALKLEELQEGATPEQIALSIDIQRAYDVVDIVMDRRQSKAKRSGAGKHALAVRKDYVRRLKEIADEGLLSRALTGYAERKLERFKESFVQREADRVKNQHVKALGKWVALFTLSFLVLGGILEYAAEKSIPSILGVNTKVLQGFMFLAIGASVGAWMSFTLRKVELGFDDLILLEPDRLNPSARVVFVIVLTCVVGGILQLGWVNISFSGAANQSIKPSSGTGVAILIGILCGIAERSLSGAIVSRADGFSSLVRPTQISNESQKGD